MPKYFKQGNDVIRYSPFKDHFSYNLEDEFENKSKQSITYISLGKKNTKNIAVCWFWVPMVYVKA